MQFQVDDTSKLTRFDPRKTFDFLHCGAVQHYDILNHVTTIVYETFQGLLVDPSEPPVRGVQPYSAVCSSRGRHQTSTVSSLSTERLWRPRTVNRKATNPEKARLSIETRLLSQWVCTSDQNCDMCAGRGNGIERKKDRSKKSQNRYISPLRGGAISQPISTKFVEFVNPAEVITPVKVCPKIFIVFPGRELKKTRPIKQCHALYRAGLWYSVDAGPARNEDDAWFP